MSKRKTFNIKVWISSVYELFKLILFSIVRENLTNYIIRQQHVNSVKILANGPSLRNVHFEKNEEIDYCMMNFSSLGDLFFSIKPKYHILIDPIFFLNENNEFIERFKNVDWEMCLLIPYQFRHEAKTKYGTNRCISIIPIHCLGISDGFVFRRIAFRFFRRGVAMPDPQNVLVAAVYSMINSGYSKIMIYGAEHSWLESISVNSDNVVCISDDHFYKNKTSSRSPYLKVDGSTYFMHELLRDFAKAFASYHFLQEYADYLGNVNIYNCTPNSFIDAFPRIKP